MAHEVHLAIKQAVLNQSYPAGNLFSILHKGQWSLLYIRTYIGSSNVDFLSPQVPCHAKIGYLTAQPFTN